METRFARGDNLEADAMARPGHFELSAIIYEP
jgi:hypothetical protein